MKSALEINNEGSIILEEVLYLVPVPLQPSGVESDGLHGLGHVPLTPCQRMVHEELLHLPRLLLAQQVGRACLHQPREQEARAVPLTQQDELVFEELPGEITSKASEERELADRSW